MKCKDVLLSEYPKDGKYQSVSSVSGKVYARVWYNDDGSVNADQTYSSSYCKKNGLGKYAKSSSGPSSSRSSSSSRPSTASSSSSRSSSSAPTEDDLLRAQLEMEQMKLLQQEEEFRKEGEIYLKEVYDVRGKTPMQVFMILTALDLYMTKTETARIMGEISSRDYDLIMRVCYAYLRKLMWTSEVRDCLRSFSTKKIRSMFIKAFFHNPLLWCILLLLYGLLFFALVPILAS